MMRSAGVAAMLAVLACVWSPTAFAREGQNTAPFDRPLQARRVILGPSSSGKDEKKEVRCFTFAHVMVKEIDAGEVGDEQISILPLAAAGRPPCQARDVPGEHVIPSESWTGYFLGASSGYVFLSAEDGVNGGLGFAVYRAADATSLFQDAVKLDGGRARFRSIVVDGTGLRLRYARVYSGHCSVQTEGAACWARIAAEAHLPASPAPDCAAGYLRAKQELAAARCEIAHRKDAACVKEEMQGMQADGASPSVIGYDVEVVLQPPRQAIGPAGGAVSCWPAD